MNPNYFFIHIPKTAGTSFRLALEANSSVRMLYDYGPESPESTKELVAMTPGELKPDDPIFDKGKFNVICGHVSYKDYAHCVHPDAVVSVVRNPVERVVSEYQHAKRHGGYAGGFKKFSATPFQQDKQFRKLQGLSWKQGALVGLTSHYSHFVKIFSKKIGVEIKPIAENKAPASDAEARFEIPVEEIRAAYEVNKHDLDYFFKQVTHFKDVVQQAGFNTVPSKDTEWNCRVDMGRRLVGWIASDFNDCFFILVKVNGEKRVVIAPDQLRKEIHEKGLSKNPVCGFSYPLALLGVDAGDELSVSIMGAPGFKKKFTVNMEA